GIQTADRPDSEGVDARQLPGIDDEATAPKPFVEVVEDKRRVARAAEGRDDVALFPGRDDGVESGGAHTGDEAFVIRTVALGPARYAAFELELGQRAIEREHDVRRRGEAELPIALEGAPLRGEVEHDAAASRRAREEIAARNHESATGHALETLVRR